MKKIAYILHYTHSAIYSSRYTYLYMLGTMFYRSMFLSLAFVVFVSCGLCRMGKGTERVF